MRALFIGGLVDNSELDLDDGKPPQHYPPEGGAGQARYRLHRVGRRQQTVVYAIYAAPDMATDDVQRIAGERDYARRFDAVETGIDDASLE